MAITKPKPEAETKEPEATTNTNKRRNNGMTPEQIEQAKAYLANRKYDPEYFKIWEEGVIEYRKMVQEEAERDLAYCCASNGGGYDGDYPQST
jgi:hypothetical protein